MMEIKRLTRENVDFYMLMGPVFGSRLIEKQTKDRFYDDPDKVWYLVPNRGAASLLSDTIKNFWAVSEQVAEALIRALIEQRRESGRRWLDGIVPNTHGEVFKRLGFDVSQHRVNFIEVYWHEKD